MPIDLTLEQFMFLQLVAAVFSVFSTGFLRLGIKAVSPRAESSDAFHAVLPYLPILCGMAGTLALYFERGGILVGGIDYGWIAHAFGGGVGGAMGPMLYDQFSKKLYKVTDGAIDKVLGRGTEYVTTEPLQVAHEQEVNDVADQEDDRLVDADK